MNHVKTSYIYNGTIRVNRNQNIDARPMHEFLMTITFRLVDESYVNIA